MEQLRADEISRLIKDEMMFNLIAKEMLLK